MLARLTVACSLLALFASVAHAAEPSQGRSVQSKSAHNKPVQSKSAQGKAAQGKAAQAKSAERKSAERKSAQYSIQRRFTLGGDGGWDLLECDAPGNRIFISRSTRFMVVDSVTGKLLGEIPDTPGAHGVALDYSNGKGFTSNGKDDSVTVFDLKTLKFLSKIKVGKSPDAMVLDSFSKAVYVFNGHSNDASVIDPKTNSVIATIALSGKPELGVSDGKGDIFVNIEDKAEIDRIDAKTHKVTATWPLKPGEGPSGLAIDPKTKRLFAACDNNFMIALDSETGKLVAAVPIGAGPDGAVFDADRHLIMVPNGEDGTLTIIKEESPTRFVLQQTLETQERCRTMTLNPKTHVVYLPAAEFETLTPEEQQAKKRPHVKAGSFQILEIGTGR